MVTNSLARICKIPQPNNFPKFEFKAKLNFSNRIIETPNSDKVLKSNNIL